MAQLPGERLAEQLRQEATRRSKMGDHAVAHDLRRAAADAASAQRTLDSSKLVRR